LDGVMDAAVAAAKNDDAGEGPWALPEGWAWVELREVGNWTSGGTPKSNEPDYYGGPIAWFRITELNDGHLRKAERTLTQRGLNESSAKIIQAPFLMFAMYGASIGKMAISEIDAATNQAIACCSPSRAVDIEYLFWVLQRLKQSIIALGQGGAQPNISQRILLERKIPLAPLAEQRRIVARVDALFAEIAVGEAALAEARKGLDTFRRALLKAAVTGELTKDWRIANPVTETGHALLGRLAKEHINQAPAKGRGRRNLDASPFDTIALPVLPDGWAWATVKDVGAVQLGRQRAPQHHTGENMRPYLRVANVFEDRIDFSDVKEMNFTPDEFKTYELKPGDILLNEGQTPDLLGRPAIWRGEFEGYCFQNTLIRFQVRAPMNAEFCLLVFRHYLHAKRFKKESQITTNIAHLSSGRFALIEFPVPPLEEQVEIVRRVSEGLEAAADTGAMLDAEAADATRLKQSILKAAFEGRLVAQDPADEPASALLARLVANPAVTTVRRGRTRKSDA
jgi:type I restriction enzyme S subunit